MTQRILVFPSGTEIGLEVYRAFKGIKGVNLIGGSSVSDHGGFVYKENQYLPRTGAHDFIDCLNTVIHDNIISLIYPAHDDVILKLAQNADRLKCGVIGSTSETCRICRSKYYTYKHLEKAVRVPNLYSFGDFDKPFHPSLPVFIKPDCGNGSKNCFIAKDIYEIDFYLNILRDKNPMICEYLSGEEYTVDCFTDFTGELRFHSPRKRTRIDNGIATRTELVDHTVLHIMAEEINAAIRFNGAWFFQAKLTGLGELCLLEVAPRIAGSSGIQRARGVNLPVLSYYNHLKQPVKIRPNLDNVVLDRALTNRYRVNLEYDHVYVDIDDTLIIDGKFNCQLIHFIFQCINRGKKVHGLTRGSQLVEVEFRVARLNVLFETITRVWPGSIRKSNYIKEKKSIFIDDSFSERSEVHSALGIPTFSVDAVECLLED